MSGYSQSFDPSWQQYNQYQQPQQQQQQQQDYYGGGYGAPPQGPQGGMYGFIPGGQAGQEMMMNAAESYGRQFAQEGKQRLEKYVSIGTLKYYFAVDNSYVGKKIGLLLFPFLHREWTVQYSSNNNEPVAPRFDVNAQDLYIPIMAYVTYVVVAGFALGMQGRFTPEQLGLIAWWAALCLILENLIVFVTKYLMGISAAIRFYDTVAFSGYKFVSMVIGLLAYLVAGRSAYHGAIAYCSLAIIFFLFRSIKVKVLNAMDGHSDGRKRKLYLVLFIALSQPLIMYWLTSSVSYNVPLRGAFRPFDLTDEQIVAEDKRIMEQMQKEWANQQNAGGGQQQYQPPPQQQQFQPPPQQQQFQPPPQQQQQQQFQPPPQQQQQQFQPPPQQQQQQQFQPPPQQQQQPPPQQQQFQPPPPIHQPPPVQVQQQNLQQPPPQQQQGGVPQQQGQQQQGGVPQQQGQFGNQQFAQQQGALP